MGRSSRAGWPARILAGAIAIGLLGGCGGGRAPTVPVEGKVVHADGRPLSGGFVFLVPATKNGWEASGEIGKDGTFRLESLGLDGAVPGEYRVRLEAEPAPSGKGARKKAAAAKTAAASIDPKYRDEDTSGLVVTIPAGGGQVTVTID